MNITRTLFALSSTLFAGCSAGTWSLSPTDSSGFTGPGIPSQPAGGLFPAGGDLLAAASGSGSLSPITWVSSLFLLSAIPAFFLLSRGKFIALLLVGVGLAILPVILLSIMDHLVVPMAIGVGVMGVGGVLFFMGRLWDRYIMKKKCKKLSDFVLSKENPSTLKDKQVAEILKSVTNKE